MIFMQKFSSIMELHNFLNTAKRNDVFMQENASDKENKRFYATDNYKAAEKLLIHGWDSGIAAMKSGNSKDFAATEPRALVRNYYVGACPNVARALQGLPDAMRQVYRQPMKQRVLTLLVDAGVAGATRKQRYMEVGAYIYQAIREIERQGTRIELISIHGSKISKADGDAPDLIIGFETVVKKASENLDAGRLSFTVAHVDMLRRISFKYTEVCPCDMLNGENAKKYDSFGYGYPMERGKYPEYDKWVQQNHKNAVTLYMQDLCGKSGVDSAEKVLDAIKNGGIVK